VTQAEGGLLVALTGGFAVWTASTDALLRYLRPGMRLWLLVAGCALMLVGMATTIRALRAPGRQRVRIGWLLVIPLSVALVVRPGPLGAYAAGRRGLLQPAVTGHFDLRDHLRAGSFAGQSPDLLLVEFYQASRSADDRRLLRHQSVRLTGFVVPDGDEPHAFLLTRFTIACCAADATPVQVAVTGLPGEVPAEETWVEVEGTLVDRRPDGDDARSEIPTVRLDHLRRVAAPAEPYESPR